MNIKRILTIVAFAALGMLVWTTFKVYFIHDPDNFLEVDARPHMVAWTIDNCKTFECDRSGGEGGTPIKGAAEADEGWIYVIATKKEPGELTLLVPRDDPRSKHLVTVEQGADGDLRIIDTGPRPEEMRFGPAVASQSKHEKPASPWKRAKYAIIALALFSMAAFWIYRRMRGDTRSLRQAARGQSAASAASLVIGSAAASQALLARTAAEGAPSQETENLRKTGLQFQSLMAASDKAKGVELGRTYLGLLLKAHKEAEAVKVFKECLAADPAFGIAQPEDVLPIAKAARAAGDAHAAVAAVRGFDKRFPGHALLPEVYVFSAKLMAEDLGNAEMAKKVLKHVTERYPGHYQAQEARRMLNAIS